MADRINNHLDALEKIQESIKDDAEAILREFDLTRFYKNPEKYITQIADAFLADHIEDLIQAGVEGKRFADEILANTEGIK